ncbi:MAG: HEAT repeat domain-containing protein [Pyrinomonadaceae bacterium MAG19_C2-C3]|nr:HEAT repeat domain-containing protein [Pyrinomonadaceae bacterium MAG19_C2-C3]
MMPRIKIQSRRTSRRLCLALLLTTVVVLSVMSGAFGFGRGAAQELDKLNSFVQSQGSANNAASRKFREGRDLVGEENWERAAERFRDFVNDHPKDKNLDAALYWLAFSLKKQAKYEEAGLYLNQLLNAFPRSNWADDARMMRVEIAPQVGDTKSVEEVLTVDVTGEGVRVVTKQADGSVRVITKPAKTGEGMDNEIKIVALQSLFQANPERGAAYVSNLFKSNSTANKNLKEAALEMLRRYPNQETLALLVSVARTDSDRGLRAAAIHTLGRTNDAGAFGVLRELATTANDDETSKAAVFAISRYNTAESSALLSQLARSATSREVRKEAIFWLSRDGSDATTDELMRIYEADRDTEVRKQIAFALKRVGTPRALTKLQEIARNVGDAEVRESAIHWIGQGGGEQAVEFLIGLYDTERDAEVKEKLIFGLSRTRSKRALRKLIDIARGDASVELRKQAVFWLGRSSDPEAAKFLEGLLN